MMAQAVLSAPGWVHSVLHALHSPEKGDQNPGLSWSDEVLMLISPDEDSSKGLCFTDFADLNSGSNRDE